MKWFTNKKKLLERMSTIQPTSKASLKMQCLYICKGDIDEAEKLYDYFVRDMPNLPDFDPVPGTWLDNTKDMANGLMGWLGENKDTIAQAYSFIRQVIANKGALPPITPEAPVTPLPPINE